MRSGYRGALAAACVVAAGLAAAASAAHASRLAFPVLAPGAPAIAALPPERATGFESLAQDVAPPRPAFLPTDTVAVATRPVTAAPVRTGLLRPDRLHHASFSLACGFAIGLLTREPVAGVASSLALGILKEVWDAGSHGFDLLDLAADAIGAGASGILVDGLLH